MKVVSPYFFVWLSILDISELKNIKLMNHLYFFHRYLDDIDDEMDPEIEEAYEKFCLESERKRKQ